MKKLLFIVLCAGGALVLFSQNQKLWRQVNFVEQPAAFQIQNGVYIGGLPQQYHDDAKFWQQLVRVQRSPRPQFLEVAEEVFLPVTLQARGRQNERTEQKARQALEPDTMLYASEVESIQNSTDDAKYPWLYGAIGLLLVVMAIGMIWKRKQRHELDVRIRKRNLHRRASDFVHDGRYKRENVAI